MKVIIEIERDEELSKIKKMFKDEAISIIRAPRDKNKLLEAIFKKYNVKLHRDYNFNREALHVR